MKALLLSFGTVLALPTALSAQVTAPAGTVTAPSAPVAAPGTAPNTASRPGALLNPAAPTAVAPQAVGRTFQTPFFGGLPAPVTVQSAPGTTPTLVAPPVVAPGTVTIGGPTNAGLAGPFSTNLGGFAGSDAVGLNFPVPFTNPAPPIFNPAAEPVTVDLPPGAVVGTSRTPLPNTVGTPLQATTPTVPNTVGTPLTPGINRPFPNTPGAVGNPPINERGTATGTGARPPAVVRPQR